MIHFRATGRAAYARTDEPLTTGSVGIPVDVSLSSDFDGLQSVMVFRSGDVSADVALLGQDVVVPPQVLTGRVLSMGVYASSTDGTVAIPTVWCDVGLIRGSVATEFDPAEPTPGWSAQIQAWAEDAADSATQAASVADSIRADMDEFNESSAIVLENAQAATTAANGAATNANAAASAANASASAADAATAAAITATRAANTATSAVSDAAALATNAAGVATTAAGNADTATAAAHQAASDANTATVSANAAASAASAATVDAENATAAASQATADATTATAGANTAADAANMAADGANDAAGAANAATSAANSAANQATAAANNANSKANAANTAANNANAATSAANDATTRANSAIDAMGDISEQAVPVMSADVRGGAKIQPDSGLEITDTDNLQVRLALESEGDVRGGLAQVTAKGHAEQMQTTGKNLLPNDIVSGTEINGVTFTVNTDGSVTVNGTASTTTQVNLSYNNGAGIEPNTTYVLSGCPSGGGSTSYWLRASDDITSANDDTGESIAFSYANVESFYVCIRILSGTTLNNVVFYPQLELGSTATDYEPYTGGLPSPRPDWEQPIEVVRGRNLIDPSTFIVVNAGPDVIDSDGYVSDTSPTSDSRLWSYANSNYKLTLDAGTYTISFAQKAAASIGAAGYYVFSSSGDSILTADNQPTFPTKTFTLSQQTDIGIMLKVYDGIIACQLERGSTPTSYVPYGHVGMEVQGRNLLPTATSKTISGVTFTVNADGSVTCNGTATSNVHLILADTGMLHISANTQYALSGAPSYSGCSLRVSDNKTSAHEDTGQGEVFSYADVSEAYAYIRINSGTTISTPITFYPQLELGSTATPYQPYYHTTTPIPLPQRGWVAGLPDGTADVLTLDGAGKCEWTLPTSEATFDGSSDESWNQQDVYTNNARYSIVTDAAFNKSNGGQLLCSHLPEGNAGSDSANIDLHGSQRMIQMTVPYLTVADFKTWLSTHNVTVLYPLATPVTEDCGYCEDWPTDIPEGAVIDIPELSEVGIKFFIDSAVTELARQWYARAHSEYQDRITALEQAVADLATQ